MRATIVFAVLTAVASIAPVHAQHLDPTTAVKGSGTLPKGWTMRFDPPAPANATRAAITAVSFESEASGFHMQSGPAAIYYNPADTGTGQFAVSATIKQDHDLGHEVSGLFIGGSHLQDAAQNYLYFVVRPQDGMAMISHRSSDAPPKAIKPYFASSAINKQDASGHATNALLIHVAQDTVHFVINGKLVAAIAKTDLDSASTNGQVGLRVNHNMDLRISGFQLSR